MHWSSILFNSIPSQNYFFSPTRSKFPSVSYKFEFSQEFKINVLPNYNGTKKKDRGIELI